MAGKKIAIRKLMKMWSNTLEAADIVLNLKVNPRRFWIQLQLSIPVRNEFGAYATLFNAFRIFNHEQFNEFIHLRWLFSIISGILVIMLLNYYYTKLYF